MVSYIMMVVVGMLPINGCGLKVAVAIQRATLCHKLIYSTYIIEHGNKGALCDLSYATVYGVGCGLRGMQCELM